MNPTSLIRPGMWILLMKSPKSLAPSEGAILLVDATQEVQAPTVANYHLAFKKLSGNYSSN